jgi:BirA family biotin operon repressor/biotin-[acetyl-CoA-carboxylase] ligase
MSRNELEQLAETLLSVIRKRSGQPHDIRKLSASLKATNTDIASAAGVLADWEYRIKKRKSSITFVSAPDSLIDTEIRHGLKTRIIGKSMVCYQSVQSTNDIAAELAGRGAEHGAIVTADQQTKGRGRLGRTWYSPPGTGIYVSVLLRPRFTPDRAPGLAIMTAVALADAISEYLPGEVQIKWPNDVWINGRKTAGILTELSAEQGRIHYVVIGVGINVNQGVGNFPEDIRPIATSLRRALKRKVRRVDLLHTFLLNLEKAYAAYEKSGLKSMHRKVRAYSALIGEEITVRTGRHETRGRAVDIDLDGRLILEVEGRREAVTAGEVTVVRTKSS